MVKMFVPQGLSSENIAFDFEGNEFYLQTK